MTIDKSDMLSTLHDYTDNIERASGLGDDMTFAKELINNIVVIGMGGSGFTGDLLKTYLDIPIPVHVIKNYRLPPYAGRKSLVITISYSGNTEETISAYRSAVRRGCKIITISSNGKLEELARMNGHDHISIPKGIQPRMSVPFLFIPLLNVLSYSGLIPDQEKIIKKTIRDLRSAASAIENNGKQLAAKLQDSIPVIYASDAMLAVAQKWKTDINENAKMHAFYNVFPEFNHNEICAYQSRTGHFHIIIINDTDDLPKIKQRIHVFKDVMRKYDVEITELAITGDSLLTRLLSTIWMGQFMSYYLAIGRGVDPTPVEIIESFKKKLR